MKVSDILNEGFLQNFESLTPEQQTELIEELKEKHAKKPKPLRDIEPSLQGGSDAWK